LPAFCHFLFRVSQLPSFMLKQVMLLAVLAIFTFACKTKPELKKTESGLEYEFIDDNEETKPVPKDDFVVINVTVHNAADSLLGSSKEAYPKGVPFPVGYPSMKGGYEEGFALLSKGDSANLYVQTDSIFKGQNMANRPKFLPLGSKLRYSVRVLNTLSKAEGEKLMQSMQAEQQQKMLEKQAGEVVKGDLALDSATTASGLKITKTPSGLRYAVTTNGAGAKPQVGDSVFVNYTGTLLNGQMFDSSVGRGPFGFLLGQRQVIAGWDEGIALLNKGAKATLFIPSGIAYGPQAMGGIPANAPLKFEVELVRFVAKKNFKNAPAAASPGFAPATPPSGMPQ
jgi:FKBP-type peptidyl-prolyl cis-trans isomerase FkpA